MDKLRGLFKRTEKNNALTPPENVPIAQEERISHFYAVTARGSIYQISEVLDEGEPMVTNMDSELRLHGGTLVGITNQGIVLYPAYASNYRQGRPAFPEEVPIHGNKTSFPVALFLHRADALQCVRELGGTQKLWDARWQQHSREVLQKIGENHPVFILSWFVRL